MAAKNKYLDQVVAQQAALEEDLRSSSGGWSDGNGPSGRSAVSKRAGRIGPVREASGPAPVDVRITGFWWCRARFKPS
ncbi:hypothetical protein [Nocardia sp. NBC_00511]|uniref:hypothetical protein n=1 Tax=Nocardia sp. NBC_00511 TaxID=2903591 RepID=UPI0030E4AA9D